MQGIQGEYLFAQGADFSGANLTGANFDFSRFSGGATLVNATMPFSSFEISWMPKANLEGGANLRGGQTFRKPSWRWRTWRTRT